MKEAYPNFLTDPPNISDLTTFYKAAKFRFDESVEFKEVNCGFWVGDDGVVLRCCWLSLHRKVGVDTPRRFGYIRTCGDSLQAPCNDTRPPPSAR